MKTYFTFGQDHVHEYNGLLLNRDCVAVVEATCEAQARRFVHELTRGKFCFSYPEDHWDPSMMQFYPRGYIHLDAHPKINGS